ncbi:MAG: ERF family protein [Proteobacteria bacterium]|nr:ERF family protein [Pseudomonadota bacterium]
MNEIAKKTENQVITTPADLLKMAVGQNADLDKMEKLMALQERWEANEAKKAFNQAMSEFNAECPDIEKTRKAHNSKYAGLAETLAQVRPVMQKHGLSHSWKTDQGETEMIAVTCCITHVQGHTECTKMSAPSDTSGSKNSIQAIASTVTYLERYTLFAILGLASKDQDTDGGKPKELISEEQAADLTSMITEAGRDVAKFLKGFKITSMEELPEYEYGRALRLIRGKK